jgi:nucleotidyltransferase substrate binding protein (TIGR01987 family)
MDEDIRWKQRFNNYIRAYLELKNAVELAKTKELSNLEKQGVIQGFEYTHELAWKVLKDYLESLGVTDVKASRDTTREAFKMGLIYSGDVWMDMIKSRNLTSHTYNQDLAETILTDILEKYFAEFARFAKEFNAIYEI